MRADGRSFRRGITLLAVAVLVAPLWAGQGHYDPTRRPRADINAALSRARTDKKLVLLDFGADWCLDCVVLSALFRDKKVAPYLNEHFHVVQIDIGEWNRNLDVSKEYAIPSRREYRRWSCSRRWDRPSRRRATAHCPPRGVPTRAMC